VIAPVPFFRFRRSLPQYSQLFEGGFARRILPERLQVSALLVHDFLERVAHIGKRRGVPQEPADDSPILLKHELQVIDCAPKRLRVDFRWSSGFSLLLVRRFRKIFAR
jgi:hypothetical protein